MRFSSAPKIRQGAPGKFKGALICVFFGARHFLGAFMGVGIFEKKSQKICKIFEKNVFSKKNFFEKKFFFRAKIGRQTFLTTKKLPRLKKRN